MDRSRVDLYLLRNILRFFLFFTAGFILHSQSFIRKVRAFHEFCASFFRRKTADCQKLRGEIKSPQSFPGFTSRLIHLFCKSSRDLLKISCFGELHSPEICRVSRFNIEVAEFLPIIPLFSSSFDLSKWIFFTLNFFVALPWNLSRFVLLYSNKIEISNIIPMQRRIIKENNW